MIKPIIAVLGANPAWQKTFFFKEFVHGKVNRSLKNENYPAGKGVNFCRAAHCFGKADVLLFQFAGGINGERLCRGLDETGINHRTISTATETRSCITCLEENGQMTELIGTSVAITDSEANKMLDILNQNMSDVKIFAVTGSLPDGSKKTLYRQAVQNALMNNIPVLLDTLVDIDGILKLPGKIILKVNREEFFKVTGQDDIHQAHRYAAKNFPDKIFAITNGADSATLSYGKKIAVYQLPEISVISPLGAGDTASAVMASLFTDTNDYAAAFKMALAAASANCLNAVAGEFFMEKACEILDLIKMDIQDITL